DVTFYSGHRPAISRGRIIPPPSHPTGSATRSSSRRGRRLPSIRSSETHPCLALATDELATPDLELEVHRCEVSAERQDFQTDPPLLDARSGRPRHTMAVDLVEAIAVLAKRVADGVRTVPERGVQHVHVLVDQCLLVALEQVADFRHDLGDVRCHVDHRAASMAFATATSVASLPRAPTMDRPTGTPATLAPGRLTWGRPVRPPWAVRHAMRARSGSSAEIDIALGGAPNGVVGMHTMVPEGRSHSRRARASSRISAAHCRSPSGTVAVSARFLATLYAMRGLTLSIQSWKVAHASWRWRVC